MLKFSAHLYLNIGSSLMWMQDALADPEAKELRLKEIMESMTTRLSGELEAIGCIFSSKASMRLARDLRTLSQDAIKVRALELRHNIFDEMGSHLFFWVPSERAEFYGQTEKTFGDNVQNRFPSSLHEIKNAGNCFAFGMYTASVFHLMRVTEIGMKAVSLSLGSAFDRNTSWEKILASISKETLGAAASTNANFQADPDFYKSVRGTIAAVKDACRNRAMHFDGNWDEEEAKEIMTATRSFMKTVAAKLDETGVLNA
jgi:hypothetical protein